MDPQSSPDTATDDSQASDTSAPQNDTVFGLDESVQDDILGSISSANNMALSPTPAPAVTDQTSDGSGSSDNSGGSAPAAPIPEQYVSLHSITSSTPSDPSQSSDPSNLGGLATTDSGSSDSTDSGGTITDTSGSSDPALQGLASSSDPSQQDPSLTGDGSTDGSGPSTYTVAPGDTLSGIAASNGLTLREVESLNPQISRPSLIHPGEIINLSAGGGSTDASSQSSDPTSGIFNDPTQGPNQTGDGSGDGSTGDGSDGTDPTQTPGTVISPTSGGSDTSSPAPGTILDNNGAVLTGTAALSGYTGGGFIVGTDGTEYPISLQNGAPSTSGSVASTPGGTPPAGSFVDDSTGLVLTPDQVQNFTGAVTFVGSDGTEYPEQLVNGAPADSSNNGGGDPTDTGTDPTVGGANPGTTTQPTTKPTGGTTATKPTSKFPTKSTWSSFATKAKNVTFDKVIGGNTSGARSEDPAVTALSQKNNHSNTDPTNIKKKK